MFRKLSANGVFLSAEMVDRLKRLMCMRPQRLLAGAALATRFTFMVCAAVLWHMMRLLQLRPEFRNVGDNARTVIAFGAAAMLFGVLRWSLLGPFALPLVIAEVAVWLVLLVIIFERSDRSSSLVAMGWLASALTDALACLCILAGLDPAQGATKGLLLAYEVFLLCIAYRSFMSQPAEVRASGYRRGKLPRQ